MMRNPLRGSLLVILVLPGLIGAPQAVPTASAAITEAEAATLAQLFDRALDEQGFPYLETRRQLLEYGTAAEGFLGTKERAEDWHSRVIARALLQRLREPQRGREAEVAVAVEMKEAYRHFQLLRGGAHVSHMYADVQGLMPKAVRLAARATYGQMYGDVQELMPKVVRRERGTNDEFLPFVWELALKETVRLPIAEEFSTLDADGRELWRTHYVAWARYAAIRFVGDVASGAETVPFMIEIFKDEKDAQIRRLAVGFLISARDKVPVTLFVEALSNPERFDDAAEFLMGSGDIATIETILRAYKRMSKRIVDERRMRGSILGLLYMKSRGNPDYRKWIGVKTDEIWHGDILKWWEESKEYLLRGEIPPLEAEGPGR